MTITRVLWFPLVSLHLRRPITSLPRGWCWGQLVAVHFYVERTWNSFRSKLPYKLASSESWEPSYCAVEKSVSIPPPLNGWKIGPSRRLRLYPQPIMDQIPNPDRVATFEHEARDRFRFPFTKLTKTVVGPAPTGKSICRPNSVVENEPWEESNFWWHPSLPFHVWHA